MATKDVAGLRVDEKIYNLVDKEIAPGTGVSADEFFSGLAGIVKDLAPRNESLLNERDRMQSQIDKYFETPEGKRATRQEYEGFLKKIGYIIEPQGGDFKVETKNVDPEIAVTAGPQLVCPMFIGEDPATNARYPLNAANARWGSLYDALYGKPGDANVIDEGGDKGFTGAEYNPNRGQAVIDYANQFLDGAVGLADGKKYSDVEKFVLEDKASGKELTAILKDGTRVGLKDPKKFAGFKGDASSPDTILLKNNGLHIQLKVTPETAVEKTVATQNKPAICNVVLESAVTAIQDLEDATAAVDAADKALAYKNLAGLLKGDLTAGVDKEQGGVRKLHEDLHFTKPDGTDLTLPGRALMLVRNVGIHMYTDAVTINGKPIPEGFLDAMITALAAKHDLAKKGINANSRTGSVYIVKPKQHSPAEVQLTTDLFGRVEKAVHLAPNTLKIGIMDEEQRMSVNLEEALRVAKDRAIFINTGFLDRTGSLIHTAMQAGAMETKAKIQSAPWLQAYERNNVSVGLKTHLHECGQIGKGMWAQNRNMKGMVGDLFGDGNIGKRAQLLAGAYTAWVPSNHAATLHAMHYHYVDVPQVRQGLIPQSALPSDKSAILDMPKLTRDMAPDEKQKLLNGYTQSILGYVVRWVNQGVGCSSVPDFEGVSLMEDRATLRIGSQLLANWLRHGVVKQQEVMQSFENMARVVDEQNRHDAGKGYTNLVNNYNGPAFQAAVRLVIDGVRTKDGYVEDILHAARLAVKKDGPVRGGDNAAFIRLNPDFPSADARAAIAI